MILFLHKLIIIVVLNFYIGTSSFATNINKNIPSGIWLGDLNISGSAHCNGKINKIVVEDSLISLKGSAIGGIINHSYDLKNPKISNNIIKIFSASSEFSLNLSKNKKNISLKLFNGCFGSGDFILMEDIAYENNVDNLFYTDNSKIPKGIWIGNFSATGGIHCNANIWKIIVENSIVTIEGLDIGGMIRHTFNIGNFEFKNKIIKINNTDANFKLYLSKDMNNLTLELSHGCSGKEIFKLVKKPITKRILAIKDTLLTSKKICEEIGIIESDQNHSKCLLAILKSKGYEDIINSHSKICEEMTITKDNQKHNKCVLTIFINSPYLSQ